MIQLSDIYIVRHCEAAKRLAEAIQSLIWQQSFYVGEVQNDGLDCFPRLKHAVAGLRKALLAMTVPQW